MITSAFYAIDYRRLPTTLYQVFVYPTKMPPHQSVQGKVKQNILNDNHIHEAKE
jgi:hypothetical protein